MIEKIVDKLIDAIPDPTILVLSIVIGGLFFIIYYKDKCLQSINKNHHDELNIINRDIGEKIAILSKSLEKQITLLEFLIYKKRDRDND